MFVSKFYNFRAISYFQLYKISFYSINIDSAETSMLPIWLSIVWFCENSCMFFMWVKFPTRKHSMYRYETPLSVIMYMGQSVTSLSQLLTKLTN